MFRVELHQGINEIFEFYYRLGLWNHSDKPTKKERMIKLFYSIFQFLFVISLVAGAIKTDNSDERVLLLESAIMVSVVSIKLYHVIWKQKEFIELCHRISSYSVDDSEEFSSVDRKVNSFVKVATYFLYSTFIMSFTVSAIVPFVGGEKKLFLNIGFPLDYQNNEFGFWLAYLFITSGTMIAGIESHKDINESTQQVESFFYKVFSTQLATGAFCICASVYCLAKIHTENLVEIAIYFFYIIFNVFNIFMIMYFGNEVTLSSDRLSYRLFESDWIDRTLSTKKCMIIFGERLKKAQHLVILKLYPMTLETFRMVLNSAYNMFNVLKNVT